MNSHTPSPGDLAAGLPNETILGISYGQLDAVLMALENGNTSAQVAALTGLRQKQVQAIQETIQVAKLRRALPFHMAKS